MKRHSFNFSEQDLENLKKGARPLTNKPPVHLDEENDVAYFVESSDEDCLEGDSSAEDDVPQDECLEKAVSQPTLPTTIATDSKLGESKEEEYFDPPLIEENRNGAEICYREFTSQAQHKMFNQRRKMGLVDEKPTQGYIPTENDLREDQIQDELVSNIKPNKGVDVEFQLDDKYMVLSQSWRPASPKR